ncbi:hypothetical protein VTK26DRAFT_670 [Humicola hyalothermophila]
MALDTTTPQTSCHGIIPDMPGLQDHQLLHKPWPWNRTSRFSTYLEGDGRRFSTGNRQHEGSGCISQHHDSKDPFRYHPTPTLAHPHYHHDPLQPPSPPNEERAKNPNTESQYAKRVAALHHAHGCIDRPTRKRKPSQQWTSHTPRPARQVGRSSDMPCR